MDAPSQALFSVAGGERTAIFFKQNGGPSSVIDAALAPPSVTLGSGAFENCTWVPWSALVGFSVACDSIAGIGAGYSVEVSLTAVAGAPAYGKTGNELFSYSEPTMSGIEPLPGPDTYPTIGGTAVTVVGTNFGVVDLSAVHAPSRPAQRLVTIGGAECGPVTWISNTKIRCPIPPGVGVGHDVAIDIGGRKPRPLVDAFKYARPVVAGLVPSQSASLTGGEMVVLGSNFGPGFWADDGSAVTGKENYPWVVGAGDVISMKITGYSDAGGDRDCEDLTLQSAHLIVSTFYPAADDAGTSVVVETRPQPAPNPLPPPSDQDLSVVVTVAGQSSDPASSARFSYLKDDQRMMDFWIVVRGAAFTTADWDVQSRSSANEGLLVLREAVASAIAGDILYVSPATVNVVEAAVAETKTELLSRIGEVKTWDDPEVSRFVPERSTFPEFDPDQVSSLCCCRCASPPLTPLQDHGRRVRRPVSRTSALRDRARRCGHGADPREDVNGARRGAVQRHAPVADVHAQGDRHGVRELVNHFARLPRGARRQLCYGNLEHHRHASHREHERPRRLARGHRGLADRRVLRGRRVDQAGLDGPILVQHVRRGKVPRLPLMRRGFRVRRGTRGHGLQRAGRRRP